MTIRPINPRELGASLEGSGQPKQPEPVANGGHSATRRTLGSRFPTRRTLGKRFPSRRTLGRRFPSRRTLGGRFPTRRIG